MADENDDLPGDETPTPAAKPAPVAKKPDPPAEPRQTKHVHTSRMVDLAFHHGYSQADLDSTPPAELRHELELLQNAVPRTPAPRPPEPEPKKVEPVDEEEEYLKKLEANTDMDQEHVKFLRKLKVKADAKDLREKVTKIDAIEEKDRKREVARYVDMIDNGFLAAIQELGPEFAALVGSEPMAEVTDPGVQGWRLAINKLADVQEGDSQRAISKKIIEAAKKKTAGKLKPIEPEPELTNPYDAKAKKPAQAQDPETGRFTAEDFARGKIAKPAGKKSVSTADLSGPQVIRQHMVENGIPVRGSDYDPDDTSDLPG